MTNAFFKLPLNKFQGQAGRGFEKPGPGENVPGYGTGLGLSIFEGSFQPKPFSDGRTATKMAFEPLPIEDDSAQAEE